MLMFTAWLKTAALERRQLRSQQRRLQAELLADAGLERAAAQLIANPEYTGETWQIGADELAGSGSAVVTIRVEPSKENKGIRKVNSATEYSLAGEARVRRSKHTTIEMPTRGESP
jgi:hypothetical protein